MFKTIITDLEKLKVRKEKFTKGEWEAVFYDGESFVEVRAGGNCIHSEPYPNDEEKANAHLMSAAPEMYEMLKAMSSELKLCIDECNEHRKNTVNCTKITPPDLIDYQSVCEAELLLAKARGEHG